MVALSDFPDVRALIDKARWLQDEQYRCERVGGHYMFGTGPSKILYPEWEYPNGVTRLVFQGKLPPSACYSGPWFCSRCRCCMSQEDARKYMNTKRERAAYFQSNLWC